MPIFYENKQGRESKKLLISNQLKLFLLIISFTTCLARTQENLVVNGSFEEFTDCPTQNNLHNGELEKCVGWWGAYMTPDYMNACANSINNGMVGVPDNFGGYQEAYDGNAYVMMVTHEWDTLTGESTGSEFIQSRLVTPICSFIKYRLVFHVSVANATSVNTQRLSVGFSNDSSFYCEQNSPCQNGPDVSEYFTFDINSGADTSSWIKLDTVFTVSSSYRYITLGDFDLSLNDTVFLRPSGQQYDFCVVYLDSIILHALDSTKECKESEIVVPNIFTPNNDFINDFVDFSEFDRVIIMGRWGNTVLIMDSQSNFEWHGKNWKEEDVPEGVYYYVGYRGDIEQKGSIQLIR